MAPSQEGLAPCAGSSSVALRTWIPYGRSGARPRLRLFCFPHAGGGASLYRDWVDESSSAIEVCAIQLPGRETRLDDEPYTEISRLVEDSARVLFPLLQEPFALFGHSLGGLIAFELARYLRRVYGITPVRLFVSGHRGPHLPSRIGPFCHLSDTDLIAAIRVLRTTPEQVLADRELRKIVLPILRADFAASEGYVYRSQSPLECPITVLGGAQDQIVSYEELIGWRVHSRQPCSVQVLPGDHFFVQTSHTAIWQIIRRDLSVDSSIV